MKRKSFPLRTLYVAISSCLLYQGYAAAETHTRGNVVVYDSSPYKLFYEERASQSSSTGSMIKEYRPALDPSSELLTALEAKCKDNANTLVNFVLTVPSTDGKHYPADALSWFTMTAANRFLSSTKTTTDLPSKKDIPLQLTEIAQGKFTGLSAFLAQTGRNTINLQATQYRVDGASDDIFNRDRALNIGSYRHALTPRCYQTLTQALNALTTESTLITDLVFQIPMSTEEGTVNVRGRSETGHYEITDPERTITPEAQAYVDFVLSVAQQHSGLTIHLSMKPITLATMDMSQSAIYDYAKTQMNALFLASTDVPDGAAQGATGTTTPARQSVGTQDRSQPTGSKSALDSRRSNYLNNKQAKQSLEGSASTASVDQIDGSPNTHQSTSSDVLARLNASNARIDALRNQQSTQPLVETSATAPTEPSATAPSATETPAPDASQGAPASDASQGAPASDASQGAPASDASQGAPASDASQETPASDASQGAPASDASQGAPASDASQGAPASDASQGAPASDASQGAPASDASQGAPASDASQGAPASDASQGAPASDASQETPASDASQGAPASDASQGAPASDASQGAPASDASQGAPASDASQGAPASDASQGAPASDASQGAPASDASQGAPASDASQETPASDASQGAPASDASQGAPASDASQGAPASDASQGAPASDASQGAPASDASQETTAPDASQETTAPDASQETTAPDASQGAPAEPAQAVQPPANQAQEGLLLAAELNRNKDATEALLRQQAADSDNAASYDQAINVAVANEQTARRALIQWQTNNQS